MSIFHSTYYICLFKTLCVSVDIMSSDNKDYRECSYF